MDVVNNPEDPAAGTRKVPFSRVLYIEQDDFREDPPKKFFRLAPGREVRLRNAYLITCREVVKDPATGAVVAAALHLRSGDARRRRARRPQGQGDAALGGGRDGRRRRGPAVRSALHAWRTPLTTREGLADVPEPALARPRPGLQARAVAGLAARRLARSVRAAGLLLRRSGQRAGRAGLQSHGDVEGRLGEDGGEGGVKNCGLRIADCGLRIDDYADLRGLRCAC